MRCLSVLIGGRSEVAARFFDFTADDGKQKKGWAPWKGKRVGKDYQAEQGELVGEFKNWNTGRQERRILKPLSKSGRRRRKRMAVTLTIMKRSRNMIPAALATDWTGRVTTMKATRAPEMNMAQCGVRRLSCT